MLIMGSGALLGGLLTMVFLPETLGLPLAETVRDIERHRLNEKKWYQFVWSNAPWRKAWRRNSKKELLLWYWTRSEFSLVAIHKFIHVNRCDIRTNVRMLIIAPIFIQDVPRIIAERDRKYFHSWRKILHYYIVGLPKIFREKSAKPHGGNWAKTWLHINFESSTSVFYYDTRALKVQMS